MNNQQKLAAYVQLLQRWNKAYNLTAVADQDMMTHHILDSLSIAPYIEGQRILDIGSGAGLPGIPLAITYPDKEFFLLDSNGKKTRFLIQAKSELGLTNISVIQNRLESYQPSACFDTITARAFASINDMIGPCLPLLRGGGQLLMMKGKFPEEELAAIRCSFEVIPLTVTGLDKERHVVRIRCDGS